MREVCGRIETLQYIEKSSRYDKQTHQILSTFLKHGKISSHFENIDKKLYKNICYLNSTRRQVNEDCCKRFSEGKGRVRVDFTYSDKKETYDICIGTPVLATCNLKDRCIYNTCEFSVQDIKDNQFMIKDEWFALNEFEHSFIPAYCVTVYKLQGCTIDEPYNIWDVEKMDKKQLYTALSRTTKHEYIHVNNKSFRNRYFIRKKPKNELVNSKFNSLYKMVGFIR